MAQSCIRPLPLIAAMSETFARPAENCHGIKDVLLACRRQQSTASLLKRTGLPPRTGTATTAAGHAKGLTRPRRLAAALRAPQHHLDLPRAHGAHQVVRWALAPVQALAQSGATAAATEDAHLVSRCLHTVHPVCGLDVARPEFGTGFSGSGAMTPSKCEEGSRLVMSTCMFTCV